jgi:tRNA threonylcarbamoyladenosine biosynthesis protein TsaB
VILLAVETSAPQGSLAIVECQQDHCRVLAEQVWDKKSTHSDVVTLNLHLALEKSRLRVSDLSHFAVDHGPGSFTGLRVGINLIKSLSYSLKKPVCAFSSLELLAIKLLKPGESGVVGFPAIQNLYYFAVYKRDGDQALAIVEPSSGTLNDAKNSAIEGTKVLVQDQSPVLLATDLAHAASRPGSHCVFRPWTDLKPLYVRQSEAEEKLKKASK